MRNFLSFIRDSEKTRLDIFCYDEKEVPDLDKILRKKFRFLIVRTDKDSILAFRTGEYSEVRNIMQKLEKFYGFEWDGEPLIYDTVKKRSSKKLLKKVEKLKGVYPTPKWATDYYKDFRLKERTKCFKTCSKCGETKLIFKFSADRRNIDGRTNICKACRSLEGLKYYYHNRGEALIQNKEYRETHKRDRSIYRKNYQEEHKEHLKERAREWYIKNREKIKERNKKYYQDHEQACRTRRKLWIIKNEERIREYNKKYRLLKK